MPLDASTVILVYLSIGAVMVGGGAIDLGQSGVLQFFAEDSDGAIVPNQSSFEQLDDQKGIVQTVITSFTGGLVIGFNLLTGVIRFMNWPIFVMTQSNAPPMATLMLGVPFSAAFYLSIARAVLT